jgi:hypothetical protein
MAPLAVAPSGAVAEEPSPQAETTQPQQLEAKPPLRLEHFLLLPSGRPRTSRKSVRCFLTERRNCRRMPYLIPFVNQESSHCRLAAPAAAQTSAVAGGCTALFPTPIRMAHGKLAASGIRPVSYQCCATRFIARPD